MRDKPLAICECLFAQIISEGDAEGKSKRDNIIKFLVSKLKPADNTELENFIISETKKVLQVSFSMRLLINYVTALLTLWYFGVKLFPTLGISMIIFLNMEQLQNVVDLVSFRSFERFSLDLIMFIFIYQNSILVSITIFSKLAF